MQADRVKEEILLSGDRKLAGKTGNIPHHIHLLFFRNRKLITHAPIIGKNVTR